MDELDRIECAVSACICTVLLITYNHKPYFRQAIESVLAQKTKYSFKIHVFDDASTDGTSELVREYADRYPDKVKAFIAEENQGAQTNFWSAYQSVDTKYCALLECDDYWCGEEKLELQIDALEQNPECSFCAHNTRIVNVGDTCRRFEDNTLLVTSQEMQGGGIYSLKSFEMLYSGYINHLDSRVIRMCCIDFSELKNKETLLYDNAQFFYLISKGFLFYIDRVMGVYNQTGTGTFSGEKLICRMRTHINNLLQANEDINYAAEKVIYEHLNSFLGYNLWLDDIAQNKREPPKQSSLGWRRWAGIVKFICPPFIIRFLKWVRDCFQ